MPVRDNQNCEISRLRTKTFELKRDLPNIEALCRELQTTAGQLTSVKAQEQKQREQAAQLRDEKSKLEQQVVEMQQKIVGTKSTHAHQLADEVVYLSAFAF